MALKALDQRLANGPSSLGSNVVTATSPRQPTAEASSAPIDKNGDAAPATADPKENR